MNVRYRTKHLTVTLVPKGQLTLPGCCTLPYKACAALWLLLT